MAKKREFVVTYFDGVIERNSKKFPNKEVAGKEADEWNQCTGNEIREIVPAVDYQTVVCQATDDSKMLSTKIANKNIVQHSFKDALGQNYLVFSVADADGRANKILVGEIVSIQHNAYKQDFWKFNSYTGERVDAMKLKAVNVQLATNKQLNDFYDQQKIKQEKENKPTKGNKHSI